VPEPSCQPTLADHPRGISDTSINSTTFPTRTNPEFDARLPSLALPPRSFSSSPSCLMLANARESHCTSAMERGFDRVARLSSDNRLKGEPRTGLLHRYSSTPSGRRASPRRVFEGVPFRRHSQRLFKTRRDKRFDLATATYAQLRNLARSEVCHYLCMEGKKELGKEKWSARSRAVKVVSLANETNIRADRVDKRRGEARRAGRKGRKREREESRSALGSALKLTEGV